MKCDYSMSTAEKFLLANILVFALFVCVHYVARFISAANSRYRERQKK